MTLPVSKYEELLETVRCLKRQTIRVRELASPLLDTIISANTATPGGVTASSLDGDVTGDCLAWCEGGEEQTGFCCRITKQRDVNEFPRKRSTDTMDSLVVERTNNKSTFSTQVYDESARPSHNPQDFQRTETIDRSTTRQPGTHMSVSSEPESGPSRNVSLLYHGTWPVERAMWNSEPPNLNNHTVNNQMEMQSVMSFASSSGAAPLDKVLNGDGPNRASSQQHLEVKVDMVYSLLSMLGTQECPDMGETLLALSSSPESSLAMRQAGCLPVLVQLVYSDKDKETREKAAKALYNLVQVQPDDKLKKRELKVLRLLEEIRLYCNNVTDTQCTDSIELIGNHPSQVTENIIKLSFDEGYRQTICELGGIYTLANLVEVDHVIHADKSESDQCVTLRRYAGMALTNLTFGHSQNKALLCSFRDFMTCLVLQLKSNSDELRQVTASVLRNLSWRADASSRLILREVGSVPALMSAAMISRKESTLKSILSALWNLSAHCSMNKADICSVEGALGFLVDMLSYKPPSKTLTIIENAGGILRNISSHIAVREDYRSILRKHNCLQVLLQQLKSPSLTIVSNACGTLWNLSAKCAEDQKMLWDMGAAPMLRSLNHSKHIMIATGSRAALKNLLSSRPSQSLFDHIDSTAKELGLTALPTLGARKQRALAKDLDQNLAETCDNIEPTSPPLRESSFIGESSKSSTLQCRKFSFCVKKDISPTEPHSVKRTSLSSEENQLIESFSSLNLSDRCSNKVADSVSVYQQASYTSNSLPFTNQNCPRTNRTPSSYIQVRNKYSDCSFEDEQDNLEEPVDYSQKYSETKMQVSKNYSSVTQTSTPCKEEIHIIETNIKKELQPSFLYRGKCTKPTVATYTDYTETDLDQPTDYSLRYAENDSDSEDLCKTSVNQTERFYGEQDTVKTYCTEGTPYETPYNFSTATSMSDLRLDSNVDEQKNRAKKVTPPQVTKEIEQTLDNDLNEKYNTPNKNINDMNNQISSDKKIKSEFSSGLMTPEKPVNYCVEGTPRNFSRVSSFSSLNLEEPASEQKTVKTEADTTENNVQKIVNYVETENEQRSATEEVKTEHKVDREEANGVGKVVTFGQVVDYAEETPLMFSRCSSLGSLSSTEQHSIHDDRSSIVSDFSRLTSGIVSPSELPDSPTQTVPPSPRHRKAPLEFPSVCSTETPPRPVQKSVFEDNVIKFKEVNTPVEFSTNTSLSSLTIDDEPNVTSFALVQNAIAQRQNVKNDNVATIDETMNKSDNEVEKNNCNGTTNTAELPPVSEGEEEGEDDMLAACINIGMQNNRHRQNKQQINTKHRTSLPSSLPKYQLKSPHRTGIPMKYSQPNKPQESRLPLPETRLRNVEIYSDTTRTYCTEDTPAMLSHAGSQSDLSVLSKSGVEQDDKPEFSDDSSNLSDDSDNMLAKCIQSGMPKARRQLVQPKIVTKAKNVTALPSRGGIPGPINTNKNSSEQTSRANELSLQQRIFKNVAYIGAKDETESYAVEDSPCHFSLRSSLSDLTVDGSTAARRKEDRDSFEKSNTRQYRREYETYSPSYVPSTSRDIRKKSPETHPFSAETKYTSKGEESVPVLSRTDSLSSLSVESFGLMEIAEQALLEQCISSGMPKSRNRVTNKLISSQQVSGTKSLPLKVALQTRNPAPEQSLEDSLHSKSPSAPNSKNVYVASVVTSTKWIESVQSPQTTRTTGVPTHTDTDGSSPTIGTIDENLLTQETKSGYDDIDKCSHLLLDGSVEDNTELSDSEKNKIAPNRMLDPDAMIESLDRFTAELVSHSSHLQNNRPECKLDNMIQSGNECGDTWNEDTSPNDVSFPSISISVPLAASFKSDCDQDENKVLDDITENDFETTAEDTIDGLNMPEQSNESQQRHVITDAEMKKVENDQEQETFSSNQFDVTYKECDSNQFSSLSTLTDSTLIAMEATKIANVVQSEVEMFRSGTSVTSFELDKIKPPSMMESLVSLTSSASEVGQCGKEQNVKTTPTPNRKKTLPAGLMVRRALSNSTHQAKSLENLADNISSVSSSCNLDHVKPPSVMGDYLDMIDMENSMVSVASITSEVADPIGNVKTDFIANGLITKDLHELNSKNSHSNWLFETKQPTNLMHLLSNNAQHSITDIENINPPSLLNEVTDLCNSTADIATENAYSETEVFEDCFTHTFDQTLKNTDDITEYSDANSITPIQSDFATSSAESTPKKVKTLNRLTPKQRRQLAKERFRTYTVAAEMVIREEYKAKIEAQQQICSPDSTSDPISTSETNVDNNNSSSNSSYTSTNSPKLTPKERRQNDRARFQTRVIDGELPPDLITNGTTSSQESCSPPQPHSKLDIRKAMRQKRLENKERFRTRTLSSDEVSISPVISPAPERRNITTEDLHKLLQHEANRVIDSLKQIRTNTDELLDCETLSLVSNEDESEHNSVSSINYRTYHKSWGFNKNLPVVQSTCDSNSAPEPTQLPSENNDLKEVVSDSASEQSDQGQTGDESPKVGKPKIVKPDSEQSEDTGNEVENEQTKTIRGRKKAMYISPYRKQIPTRNLIAKNMKPIKTMTSNLVKNVTSTIKTNSVNKLGTAKQIKPVVTAKPPIAQSKISKLQMPTANKFTNKTNPQKSNDISKQTQRKSSPIQTTPVDSTSTIKPLERQGTFTKDDKKSKMPESKIPMPSSASEKPQTKPTSATSKIARAIVGSKTVISSANRTISKLSTTSKIQSKIISSTTKNKTNDSSKSTFYTRSPSADRDFTNKGRKTNMHGSTSSQSLQSTDSTKVSAVSKRSSIPNMNQRSNSNTSITSSESNGKKKPVASKIASLWKRTDDSKKQTQKSDVHENVSTNVRLRQKNVTNNNDNLNSTKRLSRLGSFIQVEEIIVDTT